MSTISYPRGGVGVRRPLVEVAIVLGLSLGQSAVYSLLAIWDNLTKQKPLNQQTTGLNGNYTLDRPWLDLSYQVAAIVFPLVPALLAVYLLGQSHGRGARTIGLEIRRHRDWLDVLIGVGAVLAIAVPGSVIYLASVYLGVNTKVAPSNIAEHFYTIPVYLGLAIMNGVLEEVVMIGYLFTRLRDKGWAWWGVLLFSAMIRGTYHLYQGFGGFAGNFLMGCAFGLYFLKTRRVLPLVIAHATLDALVYIGYPAVVPLLHAWFPWY